MSLFINLVENLIILMLLSLRLIDLLIIFCKRIITKPIPNSTADKIRKKNVNDNIVSLSQITPIIKTSAYSVIHKNSAVKSKCIAVFTFINILANK